MQNHDPLWAAILHLIFSIIGLARIPIMSLGMSLNIQSGIAVKAVLIGFWMALIGFIASLCGSIRMLLDI